MSVRAWPVGRIFSRDKIIDSRVLNVMGAQVFRTLIARGAYRSRRADVPDEVADEVAELKREGIVVVRDFLPVERFERIRAECAWLDAQHERIDVFHHGPTILEAVSIAAFAPSELPSIYAFYDDQRLRDIIESVEQWPVGPLARYGKREYLTQVESERDIDPQTELHSDVFFNTHKAWLYLDDVHLEDGPLAYVKRSHRLTPARLGFVYRDSWTRDYAADPSRRISAEEQRRLQVQETIVTCARNTLVVANTCGYHRRLRGQPGRTRHALHLSVRANPFVPYRLQARLARYPRVRGLTRGARKAWRGGHE